MHIIIITIALNLRKMHSQRYYVICKSLIYIELNNQITQIKRTLTQSEKYIEREKGEGQDLSVTALPGKICQYEAETKHINKTYWQYSAYKRCEMVKDLYLQLSLCYICMAAILYIELRVAHLGQFLTRSLDYLAYPSKITMYHLPIYFRTSKTFKISVTTRLIIENNTSKRKTDPHLIASPALTSLVGFFV